MTAIDASDFDLTTVDGLLATTRSVRRRLDVDRPVDRSIIEECLRLALQAPTGSNGQNWRWVIVDDVAKRSAIAEIYARCWTKYRRMQLARMETLDEDARDSLATVLRSGDELVAKIARVPVFVVPCLETTFSERPPLIEMASQFASVYPAVWSFQLALRSRGLGSVLTTIHLWCHEEVSDLLAIPPSVVQCALLPVAHTVGTRFRPAERREVSAVARWNAWD